MGKCVREWVASSFRGKVIEVTIMSNNGDGRVTLDNEERTAVRMPIEQARIVRLGDVMVVETLVKHEER